MKPKNKLVIKRPDDWHLHLRDGEMMQAVLPFSAALYGRAIINRLVPIYTIPN